MTIDLAGRSQVHAMSTAWHVNCFLFIGEITWHPKRVYQHKIVKQYDTYTFIMKFS